MPWLQITLATDQEHATLLEAALENIGALAVTLGDAGDEPQLEPPPGATPLWGQVLVTALFETRRGEPPGRRGPDRLPGRAPGRTTPATSASRTRPGNTPGETTSPPPASASASGSAHAANGRRMSRPTRLSWNWTRVSPLALATMPPRHSA
jgi:hypothetical protein